MEEFPSNSIKSRTAGTAEKVETANGEPTPKTEDVTRIKKVVEGKVSSKPEPLGKRFKKMFFSDTSGNFAEHLLENVIVPKTKDMVLTLASQMVDAVKEGFEEALFGPKSASDRRRPFESSRMRTNYNARYTSRTSGYRRSEERPPMGRNRTRRSNIVKQIIVESREDGDAVLEELDALIDNPDIGHCTLGDFYTAVGEGSRPTDEEWGWTDLRKARVIMLEPDEYLIEMPPPRYIDAI